VLGVAGAVGDLQRHQRTVFKLDPILRLRLTTPEGSFKKLA
jgi:hypothetical protein